MENSWNNGMGFFDPLFLVFGYMSANYYQENLNNIILSTVRKQTGHGPFSFQHFIGKFLKSQDALKDR